MRRRALLVCARKLFSAPASSASSLSRVARCRWYGRLPTDVNRRRTRENMVRGDRLLGELVEEHTSGRVVDATSELAVVRGISAAHIGDIVSVACGEQQLLGLVMSICKTHTKVAMLHEAHHLKAGDVVSLQGAYQIHVSEEKVMGRVLNGLGHPLEEEDGTSRPSSSSSSSVESASDVSYPFLLADPSLISRSRLSSIIHCGILPMDFFHPLARGSTMAIVGPPRCHKSRIALDIANALAANADARVVYVSVGSTQTDNQQARRVLHDMGIMQRVTVIESHNAEPLAMQHLAVMTGNAIAAHLRDNGKHVLAVYDDIALHGNAYMQLYDTMDQEIHQLSFVQAKLLENAAQLSEAVGGGSCTSIFVGTPSLSVGRRALDNLCSWADAVVEVDAKTAEKYYPAMSVRSMFDAPPSRFSAALFSKVLPVLMEQIRLSVQASSRADMALELGLEPEIEEEEVAEFHGKLQEVFQHRSDALCTPRDELALLFFVSRLPFLAAVRPQEIGSFAEKVWSFLETSKGYKVWWKGLRDITLDAECSEEMMKRLESSVRDFRAVNDL